MVNRSSPFENLSGFNKPLQVEALDAKEFAGLIRSGLVTTGHCRHHGLAQALAHGFDVAVVSVVLTASLKLEFSPFVAYKI